MGYEGLSIRKPNPDTQPLITVNGYKRIYSDSRLLHLQSESYSVKSKIWIKRVVSLFYPSNLDAGGRILLYHSIGEDRTEDKFGLRISPEQFELQIKYLKTNGYNIVLLSELIEQIQQNKDVRKLISITFDDGYKDNLDNALPILNEFNIKFVVFVSPCFLNGVIEQKGYWSNWGYLGWDDLNYLSENGIEIGCHSANHKDLTSLDTFQLNEEINSAKQIIESRIGQKIDAFTYPNGKFNKKIKNIVLNSGYKAACCSIIGAVTPTSDLFELRRTEVTGFDTLKDFERKLEGRYDWLAGIQERKFVIE